MLLGDLFHSSPNRAWEDFEAWLQDEKAAGLETGILVRGNHDRAHDVVYEAMGLDVVDMWEKQGVVLTHEPDDDIPKGTRIHLCGHVHPAAVMRGVGRQSERVPCYAQSSTGCEAGYRLTLPAFGAFTGMHAVEPKRGEEVYLGHRTRGHRPREVDAFTKRLQSTRSKVRVPVTGRTVLP